ncbi:unnamed protein product [Choristocarpus tenellus]
MACSEEGPKERLCMSRRVGEDAALDVLYFDEQVVVLNKPSGLRTVPGNQGEGLDSKAQVEWHRGTKRSRQEFWTQVVHDTCTSLLADTNSSTSVPVGEGEEGRFSNPPNGNEQIATCLRRLAGDHNVPRRKTKFLKYTSSSLGLQGKEGTDMAEKLWQTMSSNLNHEAGPGCDCLLNRVFKRWPEARHVHRLDQGTSGVVVVALTAEAAKDLSQQFRERVTAKCYTAVLEGRMREGTDEGEVVAKMRPDLEDRPRQVLDEDGGKSASTKWKVLKREANCTRVDFKPATGRTHQIRMHALALGHPILGDTLYGTREGQAMSSRLMLHARSLSFAHPQTGEKVVFESPIPF